MVDQMEAWLTRFINASALSLRSRYRSTRSCGFRSVEQACGGRAGKLGYRLVDT